MGVIDVRWSRRRPARWAWALIVVAWCCPSFLAAESIDRVVLPSGLTVVIAEQHTTQVVEVRVAVRAGPVYEAERLGSGVSLLTQRLIAAGGVAGGVAGGIGELTAPQAREALAKLGAQLSGTTASARSDFVLTTTAANLAPALTLIANRLSTPAFIAEELDRERAGLAASEPAPEQTALMGLLLRQHPARLPMAGLPPLRGALTLDQVQAYHQARYRSANTVVVVCGNVAAPEARRLVEQAFAAYPFGGYAPQALPLEPPPLAPRYQAITSATVKQPKITIAWRTETLDHPAGPGLAVLASWLGGERGVLTTVLGAKGLAQDIVVENITAIAAPGHLRLTFSTTPERRAEAEQALYKALENIGQNPLDEAQVAAARAATLRQLAQRQSTVHGLCDDLLAWELAAGDPAYVRRFSEQIAEVDGIEVMRELRRYVLSREGDRGRCTLVVRPPDTKPVRAAEPARPPTPVSVVAPEIVVLPHGVRLVLRPSLEQPLARVHLVLGGAAAVEDTFQRGATSLLAPLMCRATESRSPADIDALLTTRGMQLSTTSTLHRLDLGLTCFRADVPQAMDLLVDCLLKAALPGDELELVRQRANAEAANDSWERQFLAELRAVMLAGHYAAADPRSAKAGLAHLDRSVVLAHYRRLAVGANTMLVVYGRFDRDLVVEHARRLLTLRSELTDGAAVLPRGVPWGEPAPPSLTILTHDAPSAAVALVWHGPALADRVRDEAPMLALGALLEARLARMSLATDAADAAIQTRLRTTGESYDQRGIWLVWGSCDDAHLDQVQQGVRDEVARFIAQLWLPEADRGAMPEGELAAAKATCAVRWALEQEDLDRVAVRHATQLLLGQEVAFELAMPERLAAVTRKDLLRVAQAWLTADPLTVIAKPKGAPGAPGSAAGAAEATNPGVPMPVGAVPAAPVQGGPQPTAPMPSAPRPLVPGSP